MKLRDVTRNNRPEFSSATREAWENAEGHNRFPARCWIHVIGECVYLTGDVVGAKFSELETYCDKIALSSPIDRGHGEEIERATELSKLTKQLAEKESELNQIRGRIESIKGDSKC